MNSVTRCLVVAVLLTPGTALAELASDTPRTGLFKLDFTPLELLGVDGVEQAEIILRGDDELSWQLYVPESYDPERPVGVMVYVSPTRKGAPPKVWTSLLDQSNLVWIGANQSGNRVAVGKRMFLAMLAPRVVATQYVVDLERIYIAGFSGGGKTAGLIMAANPDLFRGGIYMGGAEAWGSDAVPPHLDIMRQNYHVFLTGTEDFNERLTRRVYAAYRNEGIENSELIVERRHGHQLPSIGAFTRAIDYLDSRVRRESLAPAEHEPETAANGL